MNGPAEVAAELFASHVGRPPEGVWSAAGRVNLIGEHTDYNLGWVLPFAIPARTYVAAARRDDQVVTVRSVQHPGEVVRASLAELQPGRQRGWSAYVLGVPWALARRGARPGGIDVLVDGHVPVGAGLSSSAALECAAVSAVADLAGSGGDPLSRALTAWSVEHDFVGVPCGVMDQVASMVCTAGHALLVDTRDLATAAVPLDAAGAGLALLVVDTGVTHDNADGQYAARRTACEDAARALGVSSLRELDDVDDAVRRLGDGEARRRVRHVLSENARVLAAVDALRQGDWGGLGRLMDESHASLRDDYEVSSPELDVAVDSVRRAGALGARMTGGGFGGSAIAVIPEEALPAARVAVGAAFEAAGFAAPVLRRVEASTGAHHEAVEAR
ncbi:MAG: galactokinase [Acidobacteriota bacterium]|nr:galactokinase [Acidobacteriota bacterium]